MSAQTVGQWFGLVVMAIAGGWILFGVWRLVDAARVFVREHRRAKVAAEVLAEYSPAGRVERSHDENGVRVIDRFQLTAVAPVQLDLNRRGEHRKVVVLHARQGGKTEALRELRRRDEERRTVYSTPPAAMLLGFSGNRNGEIAVGARLDFERQIMDGDRPSSTEPRGIFNNDGQLIGDGHTQPRGIFGDAVSFAEQDERRRRAFEEGTGRTDWPFP